MARFLSLNSFPASFLFSAGMGLMLAGGVSLRAQTTMMNPSEAAPASPTPAPGAGPKPAPTPPAPTAMTNAAPVLPPADTIGQYGKILGPSDEVAHPLKLKTPFFPGLGEVKIPRQDEFTMRDKLEQLAQLSDDEIRKQLDQWPAYSKMNLRDEGLMLQRIQDFRDYRTKTAMQKAHDMGLLTLTVDDKVKFEKAYWIARLQMDKDIAKQVQPIVAQHEQKLKDQLFREFSKASPGPIASVPGNKPPANKPAASAPAAAPTTATAAPIQPATAIMASAPATNMGVPMQPMAQTPH
jgi:hypothetical protein